MARIKDSSVRDVVAAADMVEVVSGRTQLRRASGSRYMGRCPFHEERTPSFSVNPVDKLYYCFGCGKGGDLISFVRETENLDFVGAIEWLAERFRVPIEVEEASPRVEAERRRRERIYAVLEQTTSFFERLLWEGDAAEPVRAYLAERRLGEAVAKEFRLGLSLGRGLAEKAAEKGFTPDELRAAGLATVRGGDYFPQRLMFPLCDVRGRVVGFQARKLREDDPLRGKYVNSPEGDLFKKGSILYGLHLARAAISKQNRAAVVEGNTDVIALRQAGFEPAVASMGTALTERQLQELGRLTRKVYLCFDADAAGQEATLRGMELAVRQGFDVRVVTLPRGEDPADSPEDFEARLGAADSYLVHLTRTVVARHHDRQSAHAELTRIFGKQPDTPDLQEAIAVAASSLQLSRELQRSLLPPRSDAVRRELSDDAVRQHEETSAALRASERIERDALAACVAHSSLVRGLAELTPGHFDSEVNRRFRASLVAGKDDPELTALKAELDARAAREAIDERTGAELLLRLRERKLKRDLAGADLARTTELQAHLAKVRQALAELT